MTNNRSYKKSEDCTTLRVTKELHGKVREQADQRGMRMFEYVERRLTEIVEQDGRVGVGSGGSMSGRNRNSISNSNQKGRR